MKTKVLDFLSKRKKAVAAVLAPAVVLVAAKLGHVIDLNTAQLVVLTVLTSLGSGASVHQIRNVGV